MHLALLIKEIVKNIVEYLDPVGPQDHRIALISLACTCGIWSEPAIDVIWADCRPLYLAQTMDVDVQRVTMIGMPHMHVQDMRKYVGFMVSTTCFLTLQLAFTENPYSP
jgi:hypothetical protein